MSVASTEYYNPTRTLFPQLGHPLTEEHIGKRVVRVVPYRNDWSNCYYHGANVEEIAMKLDAVTATSLRFSFISSSGKTTLRALSQKWNDGNWTTIDTLTKHLPLQPRTFNH